MNKLPELQTLLNTYNVSQLEKLMNRVNLAHTMKYLKYSEKDAKKWLKESTNEIEHENIYDDKYWAHG